MKRLLAAIGLGAPTAMLVLLLVDAGSVASTIYGRMPLPLAAAICLALVAWLAAILWLAGLRAGATEVGQLVRAAERMADGELDVALPDSSTALSHRLATALEGLSERISSSQEAATVDRLTGVASRSALLASLVNEVERASRYERPLSVAFVDIDHFKSVNDTYGHAAGDIVLRGVAQALKGNLRATDVIGRYGGEEFMLILTETMVEDAALLGEKLRGLVARQRFSVEGNHQLAVSVSIGIAGGVGRSLRVDSLSRNADAAMYTAKAMGRNQTYIFSEPDEDARIHRSPVSPAARAHAAQIGLAARDAAATVLGGVVASLAGHKGGSSAVVATIVTSMAHKLDLPEQEVERVRLGAMLRDIGKVVVPDEILDKPTPLSPAEWQSVVQHPQLGQVILERAASLRDVAPIVLHHHEHFSGQGYPFGLHGNDIPLGARIVAIADAYEAMTTERPYRPALAHEDALRELRRNAGTQFDPDLVNVFCTIFAQVPPVPDPAVEAILAPLNLLPRAATASSAPVAPLAGPTAGAPERPALPGPTSVPSVPLPSPAGAASGASGPAPAAADPRLAWIPAAGREAAV